MDSPVKEILLRLGGCPSFWELQWDRLIEFLWLTICWTTWNAHRPLNIPMAQCSEVILLKEEQLDLVEVADIFYFIK